MTYLKLIFITALLSCKLCAQPIPADSIGSPAWIVEQYLESPQYPSSIGKHLGARLITLKQQPSLGMVKTMDPSMKVSARRFYQEARREAYQVTLSVADQKVQAYWIFQKIGDLWIWTDLIQESPYSPWMQIKSEVEPKLSFVKGEMYTPSQSPDMKLYQIIQRSSGDSLELSHYLKSRKKSYLQMIQSITERDRLSAVLHNDSLGNPGRFNVWKATGIYPWMKSEQIERVQMEAKGMVFFYYASLPTVDQGLIYCSKVEVCLELQPDVAGFYYLEYFQDPEDEQVQWIHFRAKKER